MTNTKTIKRYPFSMVRYGHNIELAYNHMKNLEHDMVMGLIPWNDKMLERLEKLQEVYSNAIGEPIYWATGKEYGILHEASVWAELYRDRHNYELN